MGYYSQLTNWSEKSATTADKKSVYPWERDDQTEKKISTYQKKTHKQMLINALPPKNVGWKKMQHRVQYCILSSVEQTKPLTANRSRMPVLVNANSETTPDEQKKNCRVWNKRKKNSNKMKTNEKRKQKRMRIIRKRSNKKKYTINQIKCNSNNGTSSSSYPTAERGTQSNYVCAYRFQPELFAFAQFFFHFVWVSFTHFYLHFIRRFAVSRKNVYLILFASVGLLY